MLCYCVSLLEHFVFTIFIVAVGHVWHKEGLDGILRILINLLKTLPGFEYIIQQVLSSEVKSFTKQMKGSEGEGRPVKVKLPEKGIVLGLSLCVCVCVCVQVFIIWTSSSLAIYLQQIGSRSDVLCLIRVRYTT